MLNRLNSKALQADYPAPMVIAKKLLMIASCWGFCFLMTPQSTAQERGRFDVEAYLKKLDVNKNERIDPSEASGRTRGFLKGLGFDTSDSIRIRSILRKINEDRGAQTAKDQAAKSESTSVVKVPSFGAINEPVPSFGATNSTELDATFSDSVREQVDQTLKTYDANRDGFIDVKEMAEARWGNPRPEENDTNGDGKLSRIELSNRYRARELYQKSNDTDNNRDARSRGDSRNGGNQNRNSDFETRSHDRPSSSDRGSFGASSARTSTNSNWQRGNGDSSNGNDSQSVVSNANNTEKYASYVDSLIKNYDKDGDGKLSSDEIKAMRRPPRNADPDNDGFITRDELIASLTDPSGRKSNSEPNEGGKGGSANNFRASGSASGSASSSRGSRSSGSLGGLDLNQNNQVEMHEFAEEWDEETLAQFYEKDKNRDGVITSREWNSK